MNDDWNELRAPLSEIRQAMAGERSAAWRKQALMEEFGRVRRPARWFPAFAAAAVVLIAFSATLVWRAGAPGIERMAQAEESEFVSVPYAPPLAAGELVTVVRAELQPAEMARMGFSVPRLTDDRYTADLMLGQDGVPRAIRVIEVEN